MMRTRRTGKPTPMPTPTPKPNATGTSKSAAKDATTIKSPTQPAKLSDADKAKVKNWLDKQEKPFGVTTVPVSKKRKRTSGLQTQTDLFEDRLSIQYEVKPRDKWDCLQTYKKFTVGSESIALGQCILVKHDDVEGEMDMSAQWKAKVLEVRALDSEHVYIRVAWLNRPEDLDKGRKEYHGKHELVPTNQMDIIDGMAVNGSVDVVAWNEQDDDSALMGEDQYFWRQTYDFANSKTFSDLQTICIDEKPQNPDEMVLQCANIDCRRWQHVKCIAEAAVQQAAERAPDTGKSTTRKRARKNVSIAANSQTQAKAESNSFTAEVFVKGEPHGPDQTPAESSKIVITTKADHERQTQGISCLFCGTGIE